MIYMLLFAAGYWLGSGGKLPPKPNVTVNEDGSLVVRPPQTEPPATPQTVPYNTNTGHYALPGSYGYPAGSSFDMQGNIYGPDGRVILSGAQIINGLPNISAVSWAPQAR